MLPKRIMDSSSGSLSKLVIECESLGKSSYTSSSTHDSALIQKDFTINMIQNKSYGAIDTNTTSKQHENEEQEYEHQGQSPIRSVLWNMLNQIIGTGILGIPYIYKSTGIIGSIIVMIIFGIISVYTLNLIIYCGKKMGVYNYETLLEKTFGIKGYIISSFCIAILNIGGMLTNLIIIGDATMKVLSIWGFDSWFDRQIVLIILAAIIILPFCMFRDLSSLEKAGFVKLIAISVIIVVIFLEFFNSINSTHTDVNTGADNGTNTEITLSLNWASIPSAVGVLAFSFVCHDSSFLLYNTLSNPTKMRFFKLSFYGIFIAITFTLCLSIPAYLTFGNSVESNILNNYNIYNPLIIAIRIIYIFTMTLTFPGSFFLVRHVFYGWSQKLQCVYSKNYLNNFMPYTVQTAPLSQHLLFTLSIFVCIVTISLFVDDLGIIMSSIGSISSVNLAFVFPCLCYMKIMLQSEKLCVYRIMLNLIAPLFITLTGITIAIYGVVSVF